MSDEELQPLDSESQLIYGGVGDNNMHCYCEKCGYSWYGNVLNCPNCFPLVLYDANAEDTLQMFK